MAAFLTAEQLAQQQSMAESEIEQAMNSAEQRQYAYNSARPSQKGRYNVLTENRPSQKSRYNVLTEQTITERYT